MPVTISTNTSYSAIAGTYTNGDSITITSGATFTIDTQPASGVYFGDITVSDGRLLIDGRGVVGYLYLLFQETKAFTTTRLGKGEIQGDYYQLGVAAGTASETLTLPFTIALPYIEIETFANSGIYEVWGNINSRAFTDAGSIGIMGRVFRQSMASATLSFGTGTNGRIPPAGAKIRIPNVICGSTTTATPTVPTFNATATSRYETATTNSGEFLLNKCIISGWYLNLNTTYSVNFNEVGVFGRVLLEIQQATVIWNKVICVEENTIITASDVDFTDCVFIVNAVVANTGALNFNTSSGALLRCACLIFARSSTRFPITFRDLSSDFEVQECQFIGNGVSIDASSSINFIACVASDSTNGVENTGAGTAGIGDWFYVIRGFDISIKNHNILTGGTAPSRALLELGSANTINITDCGSVSAPINLNNRTPRFLQMATNNDFVSGLNIKRCYFTAYSGNTFADAINPNKNTIIIQNWRINSSKALPLIGSNQVIKGSQGNNTFGATGIPTSFNVSGSHFYDQFDSSSNTAGAIGILFGEKTNEVVSTNSYVATSINPAKPIAFNGTGRLIMQTTGDVIEYTRPYFVKGYTGFTGHSISSSGSYAIEYDLDVGAGFSGIWKAIASITTETVSPTTGFKEKIRFTANNTATTNQIQGFYLNGITTLAQQQAAVYVDTIDVSVIITNAAPLAAVRVYESPIVPASPILSGTTDVNGAFTGTFSYAGVDVPVIVIVRKFGYLPYNESNQINGVITENGLNVFASMPVDPYIVN